MEAVVIERGAESPTRRELPRPEPADGEALVRTLRVGVDGTDHEVITGGHGGFPEGDDYLVLGHEAVGVVVESKGPALDAGDIVVPTVRRPPASGENVYFERGEPDMAPPEATAERGIDGAHGFMSEYFTSPETYLVRIPESLAEAGFLVEPVSISEKALELAYASRSSFEWEPESALVLGNGSLGLLTAAMLVEEYRVYCLGRTDRPAPSLDLLDRLGVTYVDSRETPVPEIPAEYESMDLIYEATGYAKHAFESIDALAPAGVAALLGIPEPSTFEIDGGRLHRDLVMGNKALVGSVNSGVDHFEAAAETLASFPEPVVEAFLDGVVPLDRYEAAFDSAGTELKTAIEFSEK
ncbi:MAG: threonine dehydrogenase-like Zn-dependent dehydrogenase [Natronomonas sp.]|jgi:threonine dehydrogenase-like Zn-dependent dehydrogenase